MRRPGGLGTPGIRYSHTTPFGVPGLMRHTLDLDPDPPPSLTRHAAERMPRRGIRLAAIHAALDYGRVVYTRGAFIYLIGHKEVNRQRQEGIDLSAFVGVQVVCSPDGSILTVYRNRCFRGLRPGIGRRQRRRASRRRQAA